MKNKLAVYIHFNRGIKHRQLQVESVPVDSVPSCARAREIPQPCQPYPAFIKIRKDKPVVGLNVITLQPEHYSDAVRVRSRDMRVEHKTAGTDVIYLHRPVMGRRK